MDAAEAKQRAKAVMRGFRAARGKLKQSPALEFLAVVAVGFLAGMALRVVSRED